MRTESYTVVVHRDIDVDFTTRPSGLYINGRRVVENTGYALVRNVASSENYIEVALLVTEDLQVFALPFDIVLKAQDAVDKV